ncbi:MAG: AbrB/MazE/SpoVT family DNA-binding domain-containing protein [Candidatus Accumulibacter sp. UW20]
MNFANCQSQADNLTCLLPHIQETQHGHRHHHAFQHGRIVIPKEIREALHWEAGTELTLVSSAHGVTLKAVPKKSGRHLADLIGMLRHDGPPISTEELCQPVDYSTDGQESEKRDQ